VTAIPTLQTERLILRPLREDDFDVFAAFYAGPRSHLVGGPLSRELAWRMMAMEAGHWLLKGFGRWICEDRASGRAVGLVGLFEPEGWPEPEVGYDLFDGCEGHGYATEAAIAARDHAYSALGWTTLISLIKPVNEPSKRVARRMGAAPEGTTTHERHGTFEVWRHPAPGPLA
jgi:RimJ/RimL family protein N-acetyltransferase